jgi:hypothetical protein
MTRLRPPVSGAGQGPLSIILPTSIFSRPVTGLAAASSQVPAKKLANQLRYNVGSSGSFYGYSGVGYGGTVRANITNYTPSLFVVPAGAPTVKVRYINAYTESGEPWPEGDNAKLQEYLFSVPVPLLSKIPSGRYVMNEAENEDSEITIWQPTSGQLWEMAAFNTVIYGGKAHPSTPPSGYAATCGYYAGYMSSAGSWAGVWSHPEWGSRATGLFMHGGVITLQDLVEVLEGKKIKHALGIEAQAVAEEIVAPAIRHDTHVAKNTLELIPAGQPEEGKPNPAFGSVDAVAEGRWCRFPPASSASEHFNHATEPLAWAIYEAIREYGLVVTDGSAAPAFQIEPPIAMGSPYAFNVVNPLANAEGSGWPSTKQLEYVPTGMTNSGLLYKHFTEHISGTSSAFTKQPWLELESIEPRAS